MSRYRRPMFELLEDTCGVHDIIFPPCDPETYVQRFGIHNHRSCRTNLAEVMADKNIPYAYLPDPVDFFQNTPVTADGMIQRFTSTAKTWRQGGDESAPTGLCRRLFLSDDRRRERRSVD